MSKRTLIIVLLAVSLTGNAAMLLRLRRPTGSSTNEPGFTSAATARPSAPTSPGSPALERDAGSSPAASPANGGRVVWEHFATRDPATLAARMRAAGFSVAATRGAVYALLRELQDEERRRLIAEAPAEPFWQTARTFGPSPQSREISRLWRERDRIMRELFPEEQEAYLLRMRTRFGPLPEDKLTRLAALEDDYNDMRTQVNARSQSGLRMPWMAEEAALLEAERRKDIAALLTPAELEEFNLRASPTAMMMQRQLTVFEPTEREFRDIHRLRSAFDESYRMDGPVSPEAMTARRQAQTTLDKSLESLLGAERYAEYAQGMDPGFQAAHRIVRQYGLEASAARAAYEIQRETVEKGNALRGQRGQTREQLSVELSTLLSAANQRLEGVLTKAGAEEFRRMAPGLRSLEMQATTTPGR